MRQVMRYTLIASVVSFGVLWTTVCSAVDVKITGGAFDLKGNGFAGLRNGQVRVTLGKNGIGGVQTFPISATDGTFTLSLTNVDPNDRRAQILVTADGQDFATVRNLALIDQNVFVTLPEVDQSNCCCYQRCGLFHRRCCNECAMIQLPPTPTSIGKTVPTQLPAVQVQAKTVKRIDDVSSLRRIWTDSTGKHSTEAKYIGLLSGDVTLVKSATGSMIHVRLEKLSTADQEWIKDRLDNRRLAGPKERLGVASSQF